MVCRTIDQARLDSRQEALAELGEVASRMAHEIRNPLNAIRMQVAVIRNKLLNPDARNLEVAKGQLERLETEVLRLEKLAKAFLEFGRPPLDELEDFCLVQLIEDVVGLIRPEFELFGHELDLQTEAGSRLWVRTDRAKLHQVLLNLLSNARDAMSSPGQVRIRLHRGESSQASIQIADTGCGIPEANLAEIFLPFNTCSSTGAGLGLAIARRIVETAGGTIRVQSELGKGSCFEVLLPLVEVDPEQPGAEEA